MAKPGADSETREGVELAHLDTHLFDGSGATKRDLVDYVVSVGAALLRELRDRPLTVVRVRPGQQPFMQKNLPSYAPPWIPSVSLWSQAGKREVRYALCHDVRTLVWFAGQRAVEFHPTVVDIQGRASRLVLDLDPPEGSSFGQVVETARLVQAVLSEVGLRGAVKTSGSKGLHIVVAVSGVSVEDAAAATRALAARAERLGPDVATTAFLREDRGGKVFIDPTRAGGASLACAYSPRVRPGTPVSFPVSWDDLDRIVPGDFTVTTAADLLQGRDPWAAALAEPRPLPEDVLDEGRALPVPRVVAMHEGKRRRARPPE